MSLPTPYDTGRVPVTRNAAARAATVDCGMFSTSFARLDLGVASCRGTRHAVNEDSHSALDGRTPVYVVADGVGGGAMASRVSRELVGRVYRALDRGPFDDVAVREALLDADREVARSIARLTDQRGAATVALCAGLDERLSRWLIAWVGDCRVYRIAAEADRDAEALTRDDTYRHLAEPPPPGGSPDDPARMVGNGAIAIPNLEYVGLDEGQMLALCSDGVHKHASAVDIAWQLRERHVPLARRCANLIALARAHGSTDDATVLVVHRIAATGTASPQNAFRAGES